MEININKFKSYSTYSDYERAAWLFCINSDSSEMLYRYGFAFNFESLVFEGILPINDTKVFIRIYKEEDSHARRYTMILRDKDNNTIKGFKGQDFYRLYFPLTKPIYEISLYEMLVFLHNFILLNSKDKETFKQFVESEKAQ